MNDRIFLRKYRVPAVSVDPEESDHDPLTHQGVEIESGKKVLVELLPAGSLSTVAREQLQAEAIAAKKLNHRNIPALYDFGIEDDHLVYVSEHFDGTVAEKWVSSYGPMPVSPVLHIASQVVSALSAAAFHRIVHQSINPGNLLLMPGETAEGEWPLVKVLHFAGGAPELARNTLTKPDRRALYVSPEQTEDGTIDFRSQMYSLGSTMWFLLTGAPPPAPRKDEPPKAGLSVETPKGVPKSVGGLLGQMLSVNPEARPGDPFAFSRLLQECVANLEGPGPATRPSPAPRRSPSKRDASEPERQWNRTRVMAVAAPLTMALLGGLALWGYLRYRQPLPTRVPIRASTVATKPSPSASAVPAPIVAKTEPSHPLPAKSAAPETVNTPRGVEIDFVQRSAVNLAPMAPAWTITSRYLRNQRALEPTTVAPIAPAAPPGVNSSIAFAPQVEVEVPTTAGAALRHEDFETPPKTVAARHAEKANPEVRRAEPAPPAEGPTDTSRRTRTEAKPPPTPRIREMEPAKPTPKAKARFPLPPFARPPR